MRSKNLLLSLSFLIFLLPRTFAQLTTIVLQPGSVIGEDAIVSDNSPDLNFGTIEDIRSMAWTLGGVPFVDRNFLRFDLSSIPSNAIVQQATLTLYNNPTSLASSGHSSLSGSDESVLVRVLGPWSENTITWNNQPPTDNINEVILPQDTNPNQDYILNVSSLVQDMIGIPSSNYGFMLRLVTESYWRCMIFASSDYSNAALHPKLEITYRLDSCIVLQPDSSKGEDAIVSDNSPDLNYGTIEDIRPMAWTLGGVPFVDRSFLRFDLNAIPSNAIIQEATLTLYNNPTSSASSGHSSLTGSDESALLRVLGPWAENTITWNNQPATDNVNQIILPQDTNPNQNYILNVATLVQDMVSNPSSNYGFMLRLVTENYYRCLIFASSDHPNSSLHPKLEICYTVPTSLNEIQKTDKMAIYPNPSSGMFSIVWNHRQNNFNHLQVVNYFGQSVFEKSISPGENRVDMDFVNRAKGIYFVTLTGSNTCIVKKLAIQ